jgi:hypothetical protein
MKIAHDIAADSFPVTAQAAGTLLRDTSVLLTLTWLRPRGAESFL